MICIYGRACSPASPWTITCFARRYNASKSSGRAISLIYQHVWSINVSGRSTCLVHQHVKSINISGRSPCLVYQDVWSIEYGHLLQTIHVHSQLLAIVIHLFGVDFQYRFLAICLRPCPRNYFFFLRLPVDVKYILRMMYTYCMYFYMYIYAHIYIYIYLYTTPSLLLSTHDVFVQRLNKLHISNIGHTKTVRRPPLGRRLKILTALCTKLLFRAALHQGCTRAHRLRH